MRQQRLRITYEEVKLGWLHLLQHHSTHDENVAPSFDHNLIGQASVEGPEHKPPNEHVLNDAFSCSSLSFEVACRKKVQWIIQNSPILKLVSQLERVK